jgi:hypothetical protein
MAFDDRKLSAPDENPLKQQPESAIYPSCASRGERRMNSIVDLP